MPNFTPNSKHPSIQEALNAVNGTRNTQPKEAVDSYLKADIAEHNVSIAEAHVSISLPFTSIPMLPAQENVHAMGKGSGTE